MRHSLRCRHPVVRFTELTLTGRTMIRFLALFLVCLFMSGMASYAQTGTDPGNGNTAAATDQNGNPNPFYNPYYYNPYLFGGGPQQENQDGGDGSKKKVYWQYDPALRGLVPHPSLREYGPGGDPRLTYDRSGERKFTPGGKGSGISDISLLPAGVELAPNEEWRVPPSVEASLDRAGTDAVLLLRAAAVTGMCGQAGPLEYSVQDNTPWLDIRISGYRLSDAGRHDCHEKAQYPKAEVPLDRAALGKLDQIRITLGTEMNTYDVRMKDDIFALEPVYTPTVRPFVRGGDASALVHEYTSGAVVALFVPAAATDEDVSQQVAAFAARRGLVPVSAGPASMPPYVHGNRAWYFSDSGGAIARQVRGGPASVGTLVRARQVLGPEGTFHESEDIDVYASLPQGH